jgi:DNA-binding NarL/FixJ family response regulator
MISSSGQAETSESNSLRVLVIDDDPVVRRLTRERLKLNPHISIVAEGTNGKEAVQLALEFMPDLVVMDVDMPMMNGFQATQQITRELPTAHVVLFSGSTSPERIEQGFVAGARAFVSKAAIRDLDHAMSAVADGRIFVSG